jgi:hypothetical protein
MVTWPLKPANLSCPSSCGMLRSKCTANTPPATNTAASSNKTSRPIHFMGVSVWALRTPLVAPVQALMRY